MRSYINMYRNYANFKGFLTRGPYWAGMIMHYILLFTPYYLLTTGKTYRSASVSMWMLLYCVISFIPTLSATVRRLHTLPESGWFMLVLLNPIVGWIIFLIYLLKKGVYEEAIQKINLVQPGLIETDDSPRNGGWFWVGLMVTVALGFFLLQVLPNAPASYKPQTISGAGKVQSTVRVISTKTPYATKISQKAVTTPVSTKAANKAAATSTKKVTSGGSNKAGNKALPTSTKKVTSGGSNKAGNKALPTSTKKVRAPVEEPMPVNGAFALHNGARTQLRILAPLQDEYVFIKVYEADGGSEAVGSFFIHPGTSASIRLNPGNYYIKAAYGTKWFGDKIKFGSSGSYYQFYDGNSKIFTFEADYAYTLILRSSTETNVGASWIDPSEF